MIKFGDQMTVEKGFTILILSISLSTRLYIKNSSIETLIPLVEYGTMMKVLAPV